MKQEFENTLLSDFEIMIAKEMLKQKLKWHNKEDVKKFWKDKIDAD